MTVRSFVLRKGRITVAQKKALETLWPVFGVTLDEHSAKLDSRVLFGDSRELVLEIGFGNGESFVEMAGRAPECGFLGIEVHPPGIGHALMRIAAEGLDNVRLIRADAVEVLAEHIRDASLSRVQVYFPDPWPKARHHKRRLIQKPFIDRLHRKLAFGGELHCVTDWREYAASIRDLLLSDPRWRNLGGTDGFAVRPEWRPQTKFERRGLSKGHQVWELRYRVEKPPPQA